ncbi:hypothetical protein DEIPH_ctg030orf0005 [Deinococcus phoenicis]|uniref:YhhN-like protein n=1 Tax=Deinococcus phoenicis TaxID=1476583 RepID=A0A016QQB9_9DEIO|nr:lysoplasmalogenase [Deinococcus phoenicis]EYB67969.1 hypothetical protein DEIPH_ctg030orf0005 [Deinococcus phoenicis]
MPPRSFHPALALLAAGLFLLAAQLQLPGLRLLTKALPAALLAVWVWRAAPPGLVRRWLALGLGLGALGDLLLEWPGDLFVPGLLAFLLAHLAYLRGFLTGTRRPAWGGLLGAAAYGAALLGLLVARGQLGELRSPVLIYGIVITLMLWRALAVGGLAVWGAALFVLSDSLIAVDRFVTPLPARDLAVNGLYWLGQGGLACWAIRGGRRPTS